MPETETETEWAVRYADGDYDIYENRDQALSELAFAQRRAKAKHEDWQAFDGATLISRTVTRSPWASAPAPSPAGDQR